jgi:hypothetical protein
MQLLKIKYRVYYVEGSGLLSYPHHLLTHRKLPYVSPAPKPPSTCTAVLLSSKNGSFLALAKEAWRRAAERKAARPVSEGVKPPLLRLSVDAFPAER